MSTIKFTELPNTNTLDGNSVFAISDTVSGESKKIKFSTLKSLIIDSNLFIDNANNIIQAINGNANTSNGLNATNLFYNQSYRTGSYFLNYDNITNKPVVPTDLSDLTNTTGFLTFSDNRISYVPTNGGKVNMTTAYIPESNNLYYTNARVKTYLDENFASYYNNFSTSFDDGNVKDSYFDTVGSFRDISGSGEESQSSTIRISNVDRLSSYSKNQNIRIYGASNNLDSKISSVTTNFSVSSVNFPTTGNTFPFSYRIAEFDYSTGEISPASDVETVNIAIPSELPEGTTIYNSFNQTYFLRLNFSSTSPSKGLLIYRNTPIDGSTYKLISVLGPKEIDTNTWVDYYSEDYNGWTGKNEDNSFNSIIHFPLTASNVSRRGWTDRKILSVNTVGSSIDIVLNDSMYINSDAICVVAHNDTSVIQNAINSNSVSGLKAVTLNAKQYITSSITLPDNFSLLGFQNTTKITRLPWSSSIDNSNFLKSSSLVAANNISISGVIFDCNATNSILYGDNINESSNYALNFGKNSENINLKDVKITSPIGGGVFLERSTNARIQSVDIINSGLSDRLNNLFSPLRMTNSTNVFVTSSRFENFTDNIDSSIVNRGIITNNVISNCGSGLFLYASSFVSAEDNVIIGPANEFISTPDTINSEYDSVNISLENAYLASGEYVSPNFKYQENGIDFNLTANTTIERSLGGSDNSSFGNVYYNTFFVRKNSFGIEEIYNSNTSIILNDRVGLDKTRGEFGFSIDANTVNEISDVNGQFSYSTLKDLEPDHESIVYTANFEREVYSANIVSGNTAIGNNSTLQVVTSIGSNYLSVGKEVKISNATGTANVPNSYGIITALVSTNPINPLEGGYIVNISYEGVSNLTSNSTITSGTINIVDRFVMAKGRII